MHRINAECGPREARHGTFFYHQIMCVRIVSVSGCDATPRGRNDGGGGSTFSLPLPPPPLRQKHHATTYAQNTIMHRMTRNHNNIYHFEMNVAPFAHSRCPIVVRRPVVPSPPSTKAQRRATMALSIRCATLNSCVLAASADSVCSSLE